MAGVGVVVPAGGRARRLDGRKLDADVTGRSLLDRTLDGLPPDARVVCVGDPLPTGRAVTWVREVPAFGGPLAAVAAGVAALPPDVDVVLVVGGDMPHAAQAVPDLIATLGVGGGRTDCVVVRDLDGRQQVLLSAWRRPLLARRIEELSPADGRPLGALLDDVRVVEVPDTWGASADVDTPADLEAARGRFEQPGP